MPEICLPGECIARGRATKEMKWLTITERQATARIKFQQLNDIAETS
jgi:hypothetical protein